jgi:hypothetical protein
MDAAVIIGAVAAPLTALAWGAASMFVTDRSRETAKRQFSEQIKSELATFKLDLMSSLNGTYRRTGECALMENASMSRLESSERKIDELWSYAHTNKHDMAGVLHEILGKVELLQERNT